MNYKYFLISVSILFALSPCELIAQTLTNKQHTATPKVAAYDKLPFRSEVQSLPKSYGGHDLFALAKALLMRPVKDEYETTAQYQVKLDAWSARPLYGEVKAKDVVVVDDNYLGRLTTTMLAG
jgi:hypothetical protein